MNFLNKITRYQFVNTNFKFIGRSSIHPKIVIFRVLVKRVLFFILVLFFYIPSQASRLGIKTHSFAYQAHQEPEFKNLLLEKKNFTALELVELLGKTVANGQANLDFYKEIAYSETQDCAGACFSIVPLSSQVTKIEINLNNNSLSDARSLLLSLDGQTPISIEEISKLYGRLNQCIPFAMDSSEEICSFEKKLSGPYAEIKLGLLKLPGDANPLVKAIQLSVERVMVPRTNLTVESSVVSQEKQSQFKSLFTNFGLIYFVLIILLVVLLFFYAKSLLSKFCGLEKKKIRVSFLSSVTALIYTFYLSIEIVRSYIPGPYYDWGGFVVVIGTIVLFPIVFPFALLGTISFFLSLKRGIMLTLFQRVILFSIVSWPFFFYKGLDFYFQENRDKKICEEYQKSKTRRSLPPSSCK